MNKDLHIFKRDVQSLSLNDSGTLNQSNLEFSKKTLLYDSLRNHANDLITHSQGYPENGFSNVTLTADFVIVNSVTYMKMIKLMESLPKDSTKDIYNELKVEIKA